MRNVLLGAAILGLVAGCDVTSEYSPHSLPTAIGSSVEEIVSTECGLDGMSFDIDGSLWVPKDISPAERHGAPPGFDPDNDMGTLTLVSRETAEYRTSHGRVVRLRRLPGNFVTRDSDC
jgi:hypothetical protein